MNTVVGAEYRTIPEMLWKPDPLLAAARETPGWREFHRACAEHNIFFDHIEREGKRGPYKAWAYRLVRKPTYFQQILVATGVGKLPIDALLDAYKNAGKPVAEAERDRLLGIDQPLDMEDILG